MPHLRRLEHASSRRSSASRAGPPGARRAVSGACRSDPGRSRSRSVVEAELPRLPIGIGELDRVLGGGLVAGSLVLVGGEPGIGKSTLLLQAAAGVAARLGPAGGHVLYATGEESAGQVRLRAARLGLLDGPAGTAVRVVAESEIGRIAELARAERPGLLIVDSIQTATVDELDGPAGSVGQVRESALRLMDAGEGRRDRGRPRRPRDEGRHARRTEDPRAPRRRGPRPRGRAVGRLPAPARRRRTASARPRRSACSRWASSGWPRSTDPGPRLPRRARRRPRPGSVVAPTLEGTRPLLVEVQALVAPAGYGTPRRTASRGRPEPARAARRRPRPAGRDRPRQPRRLRQPGRRAGRRGARPRPAARPRARVVAARPAGPARDRRDRRGRAARRAAPRDRASSAGCARRPGSDSPGRSSRARRGARSAPAVDGLDVIAVGDAPRRDRAGARGRRRRSPGDARLTPAPLAPRSVTSIEPGSASTT